MLTICTVLLSLFIDIGEVKVPEFQDPELKVKVGDDILKIFSSKYVGPYGKYLESTRGHVSFWCYYKKELSLIRDDNILDANSKIDNQLGKYIKAFIGADIIFHGGCDNDNFWAGFQPSLDTKPAHPIFEYFINSSMEPKIILAETQKRPEVYSLIFDKDGKLFYYNHINEKNLYSFIPPLIAAKQGRKIKEVSLKEFEQEEKSRFKRLADCYKGFENRDYKLCRDNIDGFFLFPRKERDYSFMPIRYLWTESVKRKNAEDAIKFMHKIAILDRHGELSDELLKMIEHFPGNQEIQKCADEIMIENLSASDVYTFIRKFPDSKQYRELAKKNIEIWKKGTDGGFDNASLLSLIGERELAIESAKNWISMTEGWGGPGIENFKENLANYESGKANSIELVVIPANSSWNSWVETNDAKPK